MRTPSREVAAMGMGDRPPSYSASNSMVIFLPPTSKQLPNILILPSQLSSGRDSRSPDVCWTEFPSAEGRGRSSGREEPGCWLQGGRVGQFVKSVLFCDVPSW